MSDEKTIRIQTTNQKITIGVSTNLNRWELLGLLRYATLCAEQEWLENSPFKVTKQRKQPTKKGDDK